MNYKIAVIGSEEMTFPFRQIGIDIFEPEAAEGFEKQIASLTKAGYGIIFITENCILQAADVIKNYDREIVPAIIPIPNYKESLGIGKKRIQEMVEKALGKNIL